MANANAERTLAMIRAQRMVSRTSRRGRLPRQASPDRIADAYGAALSALVTPAVMRDVFRELLQELPELLASVARERGDRNEPHLDALEACCLDDADRLLAWQARIDADEGKRVRAHVARAKERMRASVSTAKIEQLADEFAAKTSTFQRVQLNRQTQAAFGMDIFTGDKGMRTRLTNFATENVSLIHGITDDVATRVEKLVTRSLTSAKLHTGLAKDLEKAFGFPERRAKFIARDQVGKLYGQINAARQQELGVARFTWRTVGDTRVRDEDEPENNHVDLDGKVYTYTDPPFGMLPGEPVLCRCWAEPYLDDILNEL